MKKMILVLVSYLLMCYLVTFLISCGTYNHFYIKKYNIYLYSATPEITYEINALVEYFNNKTGRDVLKIVDSPEESNSSITFVKDLTKNTGTLGHGRWFVKETTDGAYTFMMGRQPIVTHEYYMVLDFDADFFVNRPENINPYEYEYAKLILFIHEVGHGMQMQHVKDDKNDVMYPTLELTPDKKYDKFFMEVNDFLDKDSDY